MGIAPSVGRKGDSCDNALAESINGLYKTEVSSITEAPRGGGGGRQRNWRPCNDCADSAVIVCRHRSSICQGPTLGRATINVRPSRPCRPDSNQRVSSIPGGGGRSKAQARVLPGGTLVVPRSG